MGASGRLPSIRLKLSNPKRLLPHSWSLHWWTGDQEVTDFNKPLHSKFSLRIDSFHLLHWCRNTHFIMNRHFEGSFWHMTEWNAQNIKHLNLRRLSQRSTGVNSSLKTGMEEKHSHKKCFRIKPCKKKKVRCARLTALSENWSCKPEYFCGCSSHAMGGNGRFSSFKSKGTSCFQGQDHKPASKPCRIKHMWHTLCRVKKAHFLFFSFRAGKVQVCLWEEKPQLRSPWVHSYLSWQKSDLNREKHSNKKGTSAYSFYSVHASHMQTFADDRCSVSCASFLLHRADLSWSPHHKSIWDCSSLKLKHTEPNERQRQNPPALGGIYALWCVCMFVSGCVCKIIKDQHPQEREAHLSFHQVSND